MDFKYVRDYIPRLQEKLKNEYGVIFVRKDLFKLVIFPFKNIIHATMRHEEIVILGRINTRVYKKWGSGKPTSTPIPNTKK